MPGSGVLHLYLGLMDLGIVAALIPAVYWQSIYIPHSRGTCQNATSWQVSNAREESWFTVLAKLHNSADPDPEGRCNEYVENWTFAIIAIVIFWLFALFALFNILYGDWDASFTWDGFIKPWRRDRTENKGILRIAQRTQLIIGGQHSSGQLATQELYHLPGQIFRPPSSALNSRHFNVGCFQLALHRYSKSQPGLKPNPRNSFPNWQHQTPHGAFSTKQLQQPDREEEMLPLPSPDMRFVQGCGFERELRDTPTSRHLEACKAHCTMCYKDTISGTAGQHWCAGTVGDAGGTLLALRGRFGNGWAALLGSKVGGLVLSLWSTAVTMPGYAYGSSH
ncbi:hypothetical protein V502_02082 [Pseudogymnoascus sp. VKM F-4520 (FW-2644)]|nr:hypothetical protein V502_02082 [Pseudogymnoascus sp. VKM F-4520 (FW-2644)]